MILFTVELFDKVKRFGLRGLSENNKIIVM